MGQFKVQCVDGDWYIGWPEAGQRIEDSAWLDAWLAAHGAEDRAALDFGDSRDLQERFERDLGPVTGA
jgi:hypothetical protein